MACGEWKYVGMLLQEAHVYGDTRKISEMNKQLSEGYRMITG
jgi:hypothetical protein